MKHTFLAVIVVAMSSAHARAQTDTTFSYQGELKDNAVLANGSYDMDFTLWNAAAAGSPIGSTVSLIGVAVADGRFTVQLDFGASAFDNGDRWLGIDVDGVPLSPRSPITRTPYSIQTRGINVDENENVGIGTTDPQHLLHVVGDTNAANAIYGYSTELANAAAGVYGRSDSGSGYGVYGLASQLNGSGTGVYGKSNSSFGYGVFAYATHPLGQTYGVYSVSQSIGGTGVYGEATNNSGTTYGVSGKVRSPNGTGVYGYASSASGNNFGVYGISNSATGRGVFGDGNFGVEGNSSDPDGRGLFGYAASITGDNYGVYGLTPSVDGTGVYGYATSIAGFNIGVWGSSESSQGRGLYGTAVSPTGITNGIRGLSLSNEGTGVSGHTTSSTGTTYGVYGESASPNGYGVFGRNDEADGRAMQAIASNTSGTGIGIYASCGSATGFDFYAGGAGTNYGATSSRRWKNDIENIDHPLEKLSQLRGVYFTWDEEHGGQLDLGMIAEEVGAILPEIVQYEENGIDAIGMDYSKMTPLLVEAVNELHAEKDGEIADLRSRIFDLERLVEQLISERPEDQRSGH